MDTTIKFKTSTFQRHALEQAAELRGVSMSKLLRQAVEVVRRGLLVDDQALAEFRRVRELANAAMAALDPTVHGEAADKIREAVGMIHRVATRNLKAAQ